VEGRQTLQKIIGNSGWMLFDKAFRLGLVFVVNVWVTRYLGPAQFGMLSYASAFVSLFLAIANLGLFGIVIRDVVRYPDERHEILGSALFLKLCGGMVCLAISIASILIIHPDNPKTVLLVAIVASGMIFQAFEVFDFWFLSQLQSKNTLMANLPAFVLCSAVKIGLILAGASLVAFAWVALAEIILSAIGFMTIYQLKTGSLFKLRVKWIWISRLLKDSTPLIFAGLMVMIYNRIDQVMLGSLLGDSAVGLYSAAVKLAEFWYVFPGLVLQSLLSTIVTSKESGKLAYERTMQRVFDGMALISAMFVLPLFFGARWLVVHLYGPAYSEAGPLLGVYVFAGIFVMLGHAREYWITSENITRFSLYSTTVGALVNVALNLVLIPRYGAIGAAYSTLLALVVGSYLINLCSCTTRPVFRMQTKALLLFPAALRLMREARGLSRVSDVTGK
jgi:PST family polysaccharide transporter